MTNNSYHNFSGHALLWAGFLLILVSAWGASVWWLSRWDTAAFLAIPGDHSLLTGIASWIIKLVAWCILNLAIFLSAWGFKEILDNDVGESAATKLSFLPSERKARLDAQAKKEEEKAKQEMGQVKREAERLKRNGKPADAIRLYAMIGAHDLALETVSGFLPADKSLQPVRHSLIRAGQELLSFEQSLSIARRAGVDEAVTGRAAQEANATAKILWERAQRIALLSEHQLPISPRIQQGLQRETDRLNQLVEAIWEAREGLAELTLGGGSQEVARVENRFRSLATTARAVQDAELI